MKTLHQEENQGPVYERESYMHGGGWISFERGVVPGTVRVINGVLSKAGSISHRRFRKSRIDWISIHPEALRKVPLNERPL